MFLTFLGANGTVTGSKTLVETAGGRLLVDCGLFQGPRDIRALNWAPFPLPPEQVTSVVLTHAHLDHCGYLPALVRDGFAGPVLCTPNTAELASIVLRDSAKLQEEDAEFAQRKGFSRHTQPRALYGIIDAEQAIALFRPIEFGTEFSAVPGLTARFDPVSGSQSTEVRAGAPPRPSRPQGERAALRRRAQGVVARRPGSPARR